MIAGNHPEMGFINSRAGTLQTERTIMNKGKKKRASKQPAGVKQLRMRITVDDPLHIGLKKIKISGKELGSLPPSLYKLTELQVLDLSPEREACLFYHLTELPPAIGNLCNLTVLAVDTNKLTRLPEEIGELACLERLALSNNQLSELPRSFSRLFTLRSLYCSNNCFKHFPTEVCQLKSLAFVDFSDNFLKSIPEEIGSMDSLESLVLSYNQIEHLPESICNLKTLQMLWLSGNNLRELPRGFGRLKNLDWNYMMISSTLDGNPLENPPLSIAKQGPEAIEKYLSLHPADRNKQIALLIPENGRKMVARNRPK